MERDERELIDRLIRREPGAWERFLVEYGPALYRAARARLPLAAAEDVSQKVLALLIEDDCKLLRSFEGRSSLSTWLVGITMRQSMMQSRSDRRQERRERNSRDLLQDLERDESRESLNAALAELAPRDRLLIALYYYDELSYEEIASALDVSPNSVSPLLQRARERLRTYLLQNR
jgi:RNA polymerase sigma-70 factor (ECF subfamily)